MRAAERLTPAAVGLTDAEYLRICTHLEREPNSVELGMFGVLWSEHCSYKHSKPILRRLPTEGPHVLQGPGENAGAVDIGDGLAAVMKIESHNHPSAVEPFQGAATGVGGILRDIFTMGARPIALMDALCFGDPRHARTTYLLGGVVGGIGFYGNCVGVPTVGGSITFHPSFTGNPLVNALCLGIVRADRLTRARAAGVGNPVLLVGSATGRDGIAGASFASAELNADSEENRPAVQVGNPFLEKLLIEACLELLEGSELAADVVAMQDLGAAGLTGAVTEAAASGGCGIEIDVARVSRRERGMTPYEVMLSESQERMLVVVRRGAEARVQAVFNRWDLHSDVIGRVTDDGQVRVRDDAQIVAEVPAAFLSRGFPEYQPPDRISTSTARPTEDPPFPIPEDLSAALLDLLHAPNVASRRYVFEQYDYMVQTNTVVSPGEGAAVLRLKGSTRGLALGLGVNPRVCQSDAWQGGAWVVAEACRNVACAGARPVALTDCLNFGDPERPAVWSALTDVAEGMRAACLALDVPIISGNVSLYNETDGVPIAPTPVIGALGLIDDVAHVGRAILRPDQVLWLIGSAVPSLGASEYAARQGWDNGAPARIDLDLERRVQGCIRELVGNGIAQTATDVTEGGVAVALAELGVSSRTGVQCGHEWMQKAAEGGVRLDCILFGEAPSRVIAGTPQGRDEEVTAAAARWTVPCTRLGVAGGSEIRIGEQIRVSLDDAYQRWATALEQLAEL